MKKLTLIALISTVIMFASCRKEASPVASGQFKYDNTNLKEIIHKASPVMYNRIYNHVKGPIVVVTCEMGRLLPNPADFECYEPYNQICAIVITGGPYMTLDSTTNTVVDGTATLTTDTYSTDQLDSVVILAKNKNWDLKFLQPGKGTLIMARPDAPVAYDAKQVIAKDTVTATGDVVKVIQYATY
jgi:hypothetical protein